MKSVSIRSHFTSTEEFWRAFCRSFVSVLIIFFSEPTHHNGLVQFIDEMKKEQVTLAPCAGPTLAHGRVYSRIQMMPFPVHFSIGIFAQTNRLTLSNEMLYILYTCRACTCKQHWPVWVGESTRQMICNFERNVVFGFSIFIVCAKFLRCARARHNRNRGEMQFESCQK